MPEVPSVSAYATEGHDKTELLDAQEQAERTGVLSFRADDITLCLSSSDRAAEPQYRVPAYETAPSRSQTGLSCQSCFTPFL